MSAKDVEVEPIQGDQELEGQEVEGADELSKEEQFKQLLKESIQVNKEDLGGLRVRLTVTVPTSVVSQRSHEQFSELRKEAAIPGFRRGHAPLKLVEKRFATDVGEQLKTQLVGGAYFAAVDKEGLKPLGDPLFCVTAPKRKSASEGPGDGGMRLMGLDEALDQIPMPRDSDLTFTCEVDLRPEFALPSLENIPLKKPDVTVTDEDVDRELDLLRRSKGRRMPADGPVQQDDYLAVSMKITVDGQEVYAKEHETVVVRAQWFQEISVPNFGELVVGKRVGDSVRFSATIPDDYNKIDLRGKQADFEVTIREHTRLELPELDEAYFDSFDVAGMDELRRDVRDIMERRCDEMRREALRKQVVDWLLANTQVQVPDNVSSKTSTRYLSRMAMEMLQSGVAVDEVYKKVDEMRGAMQERAKQELQSLFILEKIADELEVQVDEAALNGAIANMAARSRQRFDRVRDELAKRDQLQSLYLNIRDNLVLDKLVEQAQVED